MWANNKVTESLNLQWPIFQVPMGEYTTQELFAGQSLAITREMPAADLVRTLVDETNECLRSRLV